MTAFDAVSIDSHQSQPLADLITSTSHDLYETLPRHGKPTIRANGRYEWTILATISLVVHTYVELVPGIEIVESTRVLPVSLGTGVKVLPATKLPPTGDTLHDSHAEVLARRGLVRWLIEEAGRVAKGKENEELLEWVNGRFRLRDGVEVWLYISALPCGDASTLHTAIYQDAEMAAIKAQEEIPVTVPGAAVRGRNGYENYGAIRTKPGRADSPPTISFSCSDKIATWSVLGLQGAMLEPLFEPVYLTGVVVGGVQELDPSGEDLRNKIRPEIARAIWGRVEMMEDRLPPPFRLQRPEVIFTSVPFAYSRASISALSELDPSTSTVCISHVPLCTPVPEVIVNGGKQGGVWKAPGLSPLGWKARSKLCKLEIMTAFIHLQELLNNISSYEYPLPSREITYYELKHRANCMYPYVKTLLRGHLRAPTFLPHFEKCGELHSTGCSEDDLTMIPPFRGWIVSGEKWESFTIAGKVLLDPDVFIPYVPPTPIEDDISVTANAGSIPSTPSDPPGTPSLPTVVITTPTTLGLTPVESKIEIPTLPLADTPTSSPLHAPASAMRYADIVIHGKHLEGTDDQHSSDKTGSCQVA